MATENYVYSPGRVKTKTGSQTDWEKALGFSPMLGELIVYNVDSINNHPRLKVGDGSTNVNSLPFFNYPSIEQKTTADTLALVINSNSNKKTYDISCTGNTLSLNIIGENISTYPVDFECNIDFKLTSTCNVCNLTWGTNNGLFLPRINPVLNLADIEDIFTVRDDFPSPKISKIVLPTSYTGMCVRLHLKYAFGTIVVEPELYNSSSN